MAQNPRARLRELRIVRKQSQERLAVDLGCSAALVSAIERGERTPGLSIALAIEAELGIPAREWRRAG